MIVVAFGVSLCRVRAAMPSLSAEFIAKHSMGEIYAAMINQSKNQQSSKDISQKVVVKNFTPTKIGVAMPTQTKVPVKKNKDKSLMDMANTPIKNVQLPCSYRKGRPLTRREIIHGWW